jgi:hypothetical protein
METTGKCTFEILATSYDSVSRSVSLHRHAPREMKLQMSSLLYRCQRIIILVRRVCGANRSSRESAVDFIITFGSIQTPQLHGSNGTARHPRRSVGRKKRKERYRHLRQRQKQKSSCRGTSITHSVVSRPRHVTQNDVNSIPAAFAV